MAPGCIDNVVLNAQVLQKEVRGAGGIGMDAAYSGRCQEDVFGRVLGKEAFNRRGVLQVQLCMAAQDQLTVAARLQAAGDGRSHQASMSRDIDA